MRMRAAITGAGGFIGGRLVRDLPQLGWDIYAITSHPENIHTVPQVTVVGCDWSEEGIEAVFQRTQDANMWIHTAARVDFNDQNLLGLYRNNAALTEYLARRVACLNPHAQLIYLSSVSVFGKDQEISIDHEPQPDTNYGLSKLLGERFCAAYLSKQCLIYRLAGVWGSEKSSKAGSLSSIVIGFSAIV